MKLEIWFEFASTYSYLTVHRAEPLLQEANVDFAWRPFLLGPIFQAKGWSTSPFNLDPEKGAYMWRDLERRAAKFGAPFRRPHTFPMNGLKAARVMTAALGEPWCGDFARAVFTAEFVEGLDIGEEAVLARTLEQVGASPGPWLDMTRDETVKASLRACTERAQALGVFGAPSFIVGDELFWGDDRLEDAIAWARQGETT